MSTPPRAIAGILACACALVVGGLAPAQGEAELRLVLPGASLPGLHPTAPAPATAIADLAAGLPSQLAANAARAEIQTSGASGVGRLLRSDAFAFASAATARRVLLAWRSARPARPARVGDGGYTWPRHAGRLTRVTIAWREGSRIGVIALSAARGVGDADAVAKGYAVLADGWLRTPLPRTAWGRVLEQIRPDGGVSKRTALDAFAVAYGPLPGVRVPAGSKTAAQSGTLAAEWILSYLPQLTAPQRRVVQLRLGLLGSVRSARVADLGDPGFHPEAGFQAIVDHWIGVESSNLGRPLGLKAVAGTTSTSVNAYADSLPLNAKGGYGAGQPAICRVRVPPIGQSQKSDFEQLVLAHEVFHCFQFDLLGTGAWKPPSAWITEGTADWVAQTVDPVTYDLGGGNLTAYIGSPMTPLFERSSDATGFWGHVQDTVGNLWQQLPAIITASSNRKAFVTSGAESDAFLSTWGSSFLRYEGGLGGPPWHIFSPIVPPALGTLGTPADTINGSGIAAAPPYTTAVYIINAVPGQPLEHIGLQGIGRLSPVRNYTDLKDAWFCIGSASCKCPPNSAGEVPPTRPLEPQAALALTGNPDDSIGSFADVRSESLDGFCSSKQPAPTPKHGGTGVSNGDPYVTTFDRGGYGFQTAGEFTLVKSIVDNLEIQSRQVPYPFHTFPQWAHSLAMNTAFAMRDGGATVQVDAGSPLVLYIDHHRRHPRSGQSIALAGGGRVKYDAGQTVVAWRDGTRAVVFSIGNEGVNIAVAPSPRRAGLLRGLLGADDGHTADDFVGRDGRRYPADQIQSVGLFAYTPAEIHTLLAGFGRSWRISQRESLFVYPRGKSTRSYLVAGFPRTAVSLSLFSPGRRRAAANVCRRAHVTNATLLAGCEIDYGATGSRLLATSTGTLQRVSGFPGSTTTTPSVSVSDVPWTQLSSQLTTSTSVPSIASAGGQVVVTYRHRADQAIEAATFTAGTSGVSGVSLASPFAGWTFTSDPALLAGPGGGVQVIEAGDHTGVPTDPLNGTVIAARNADGSFGAATQLSPTVNCCVTSATLAADGTTPIWTNTLSDTLVVSSGSTAHDLSAESPGVPLAPTLGRDTSGRLWLAWYALTPPGGPAGLYMMQLDPETGAAAGPAIKAPGSDMGPNANHVLGMACAQTCRLVYVNSAKLPQLIVSWAPGEAATTRVLSGLIAGKQQVPNSVVAAYTADGRLWVSWLDNQTPYAELGDSRGVGGTVIRLRTPPGYDVPGNTVATTVGNMLALATNWSNGSSNDSAVWATTVTAP